jgi:hypothetical protein
LQKSLKTFNWFCISSFESDIITVSSAYKSTKSFKYTASSISKSSVIDVRPLIFLCLKTVPNHLNTSRKGKGKVFSSGSFNAAKKDLVNKGTKAMYEVLKKGRLHNLSIQCQLDIFDKTVKPILLYGCETWGFGMSFDQYEIIRTLISMSIGYRPNSP